MTSDVVDKPAQADEQKDAKQLASDAKAAAAKIDSDNAKKAFETANEAKRQARLAELAGARQARDAEGDAAAKEKDRIEKAAIEAVAGMAVLRNEYRGPLQLGKVILQPKKESAIHPDVMAKPLVQGWIKAGILVVVKKAKK